MWDQIRQMLITIMLWLLWGLVFLALELMIRQSGDPDDILITAITYLLPPVVIGWPFALLENRLFLKRPSVTWKNVFSIRVLVYCCAIYAVYMMTRTMLGRFYPTYSYGDWFELKFVLIWGMMMIVYLTVRNVISHFDLRTIKSWITGEYYKPVEEGRIFLFIDLNDSTPIAERMGSRLYFDFLNDFHIQVDKVISKYDGEIFQYVGDEVVITWKTTHGLKSNNAIEAFFSLKKNLSDCRDIFLEKYGELPSIKGAMHIGTVTKGELGRTRKDFAYVGDVLNTTSRMYGICKDCDASLVVSRRLLRQFFNYEQYSPVSFGYFRPVGKEEQIFVYSISK